MYDVSAQGVDERMINVHYYYYYWYMIQTNSAGRHRCIRFSTNLASEVCKIHIYSSRRLNKGLLIVIARTGMRTSAIVPDLLYIGCSRFPFL